MKDTFGKMPGAELRWKEVRIRPWVSRVRSDLGHEAIVAHARNVRLIGEGRRKDDRLDAQALARLARIDSQLLSLHVVSPSMLPVTSKGQFEGKLDQSRIVDG
jgi:transposase